MYPDNGNKLAQFLMLYVQVLQFACADRICRLSNKGKDEVRETNGATGKEYMRCQHKKCVRHNHLQHTVVDPPSNHAVHENYFWGKVFGRR